LKKRKDKLILCVFWTLFFGAVFSMEWVCAEESEKEVLLEAENAFLKELELSRLDENLTVYEESTGLNFSRTVKKLISGELPFTLETLKKIGGEILFGELQRQKAAAVSILTLLLGAAMFSNFAGIFEKSQVSDVSFYVIYLLLFTMLTKTFFEMSRLAEEALEQILTFMKLLMPAYLLSALLSSQALGGAAFYELILTALSLVQWGMRYVILPAVNFYFLFTLLNHISGEDYLSKMAGLLKSAVEWILKSMTAAILGLQAVQSLILPAVDAMKQTVLQKSGGSIPVIGEIFNNATEMVLGAAVLIRNGVGTAGLIVLLFLCLSPALKLLITGMIYRVLAAGAQPVADKRLMECLDGCGKGILLLLRVVICTGMLFFLALALALASR
jgi:stage III sporulation protein AE